jgi:hypothetical protein
MSKELLNFMTWVNQDEKLGYTSIGIERIVNRYITSKDLIIRDAYENYSKEYEKDNSIGMCLLVARLDGKKTYRKPDKEMFVGLCTSDKTFSEKWGLKIEERELSLEERCELGYKYVDSFEWDMLMGGGREGDEGNCNDYKIPTKLITITYNDKTIESYE